MKKQVLINKLKKIRQNLKHKNCAIAYSGGQDSTTLLEIIQSTKKPIIHINHNINKECKLWEKHCLHTAKIKNLKIIIIRLKLCKFQIKQTGLEATARTTRYKTIRNILKHYHISTLITAHTLNDKIETYFLNLIRGCGLTGLTALKYKTTLYKLKIIRPLITISKQQLATIVKHSNHITDKSNKDLNYKRNIIRIILEKEIYFFFPNYMTIISKHIKLIEEYKTTLNTLAKTTLKATKLKLKKLKLLKPNLLKNLIRYLCEKNQIQISSINWIKEIAKQLTSNSKNISITNKNAKIYIKSNKLKIKKIDNTNT